MAIISAFDTNIVATGRKIRIIAIPITKALNAVPIWQQALGCI